MTVTVLARNEWLKTTRRLAFWVTLLCLGGLMSIMFFERYSSGVGSAKVPVFQLPDGWSYIIGEPGPIPAMFAAILMILLVASEFSWRTARQNVIDGLSRAQFYAGKTLLLPAVAAAVLLLVVLIGVGFALPGTAAPGPVMGGTDLAFLGGSFLAVAGMGAMGLLLASVIRSAGAAMALFFFYLAFAERILAAGLGRLVPASRALAPYWPANLFMTLPSSEHYYVAEQEAAIARALEKGVDAPTFMDPGLMAAAAGAWIALFLVAGFVAFRRRDL